MDSMLLLHLFIILVPQRLKVISVDHQLQVHSAEWSAFVAVTCQQYDIPYDIIKVEVNAEGNTEAQARTARYQAFLGHLNPNDVLVLAHHQQDQAETVLLRLLQGSGVRGLSAMRETEIRQLHDRHQYHLWRPLLSLSRQHIEQWSQQLQIQYVHDPMNFDTHYDRVWCRQVLWDVLEQRFPRMQDSIARCADLMQDADEILNEVLEKDYANCVDAEQRLDINRLQRLSIARQRQLLSAWMQADQQFRPPLAMIERLQLEVILARQDANSLLHYANDYFVRFDQYLYRYSAKNWLAFQQLPEKQNIQFVLGQRYQVAVGQVYIESVSKTGLTAELLNKPLTLVPRQGGEKIQFYGRDGHRILKKTLQDAKIAPWFRHQIQILMYHNTVLGVFTPQGFWLAQNPFCGAGGWLPQLQTN